LITSNFKSSKSSISEFLLSNLVFGTNLSSFNVVEDVFLIIVSIHSRNSFGVLELSRVVVFNPVISATKPDSLLVFSFKPLIT